MGLCKRKRTDNDKAPTAAGPRKNKGPENNGVPKKHWARKQGEAQEDGDNHIIENMGQQETPLEHTPTEKQNDGEDTQNSPRIQDILIRTQQHDITPEEVQKLRDTGLASPTKSSFTSQTQDGDKQDSSPSASKHSESDIPDTRTANKFAVLEDLVEEGDEMQIMKQDQYNTQQGLLNVENENTQYNTETSKQPDSLDQADSTGETNTDSGMVAHDQRQLFTLKQPSSDGANRDQHETNQNRCLTQGYSSDGGGDIQRTTQGVPFHNTDDEAPNTKARHPRATKTAAVKKIKESIMNKEVV